MESANNNVVRKAIAEFARRNGIKQRGSQKAFAQACGVTRQTVRNWCMNDSVPISCANKVSQLTGFPMGALNSQVRKMFAAPESASGDC